jgi:sigma-B regulation protein RsbU (phosphoserine phosphatase)
MEPGDLFAVPTDGFMEALNEHGEEYGTARMVDLFREHRALPLDELLEVVREDTESFHQNIEPADDRTVLVVRRTSNGR